MLSPFLVEPGSYSQTSFSPFICFPPGRPRVPPPQLFSPWPTTELLTSCPTPPPNDTPLKTDCYFFLPPTPFLLIQFDFEDCFRYHVFLFYFSQRSPDVRYPFLVPPSPSPPPRSVVFSFSFSRIALSMPPLFPWLKGDPFLGFLLVHHKRQGILLHLFFSLMQFTRPSFFFFKPPDFLMVQREWVLRNSPYSFIKEPSLVFPCFSHGVSLEFLSFYPDSLLSSL